VRGRRGFLVGCGVVASPPPAYSEEHEACDGDSRDEDEVGSCGRVMLLSEETGF
jgi:hypothetical protein